MEEGRTGHLVATQEFQGKQTLVSEPCVQPCTIPNVCRGLITVCFIWFAGLKVSFVYLVHKHLVCVGQT